MRPNYGYEKGVLGSKDHIFGVTRKIPDEILMPSRNWGPYLPTLEQQFNNLFDGFTCTNFGNCNASEIVHKFRYSEEINYSDRFSAIISGTIPNRGNSPLRVAEATRLKGYVLEGKLPFTPQMTEQEYFLLKDRSLYDLGLVWVQNNEYGYESVTSIDDIPDAIMRSPLIAGVDSEAYTRADFVEANHCIVIYNCDVQKGTVNTFDSYLGRDEEYPLDYPFDTILRIHYKRKEGYLAVADPKKIDSLPDKIKKFIIQLIETYRSNKQ